MSRWSFCSVEGTMLDVNKHTHTCTNTPLQGGVCCPRVTALLQLQLPEGNYFHNNRERVRERGRNREKKNSKGRVKCQTNTKSKWAGEEKLTEREGEKSQRNVGSKGQIKGEEGVVLSGLDDFKSHYKSIQISARLSSIPFSLVSPEGLVRENIHQLRSNFSHTATCRLLCQ